MDTPELQQFFRRYKHYERLAKQYNAVVDERAGGDVHLIIDPVQKTMTATMRLVMHDVVIPKSIPRDRPTAWYVERYCHYTAKADNAHALYMALRDAHQKGAYEAMSREEKLARLREIGAGLARAEEALTTWRAEVPARERTQAERDPRPMIAMVEDVKREREAERD